MHNHKVLLFVFETFIVLLRLSKLERLLSYIWSEFIFLVWNLTRNLHKRFVMRRVRMRVRLKTSKKKLIFTDSLASTHPQEFTILSRLSVMSDFLGILILEYRFLILEITFFSKKKGRKNDLYNGCFVSLPFSYFL
jgi:hypothetical protein